MQPCMDKGNVIALISEAERKGAEKALVEAGLIKELLSERQAVKRYGKTLINRWRKEKLITPIKAGSNTSQVSYHRDQLHRASITEILYATPIGNQ